MSTLHHLKGFEFSLKTQTWEYVFSHSKPRHICQVKFCRNDAAIRNNGRGYLVKDKVCGKCATRRKRLRNPEKYVFENLKRSADMRNIPFKLTFKQFLRLVKNTNYIKLKGRGNEDLQIDRIEDGKGYVLGNLQVVYADFNRQKERDRRKYVKGLDDNPF